MRNAKSGSRGTLSLQKRMLTKETLPLASGSSDVTRHTSDYKLNFRVFAYAPHPHHTCPTSEISQSLSGTLLNGRLLTSWLTGSLVVRGGLIGKQEA